MKLLAPIVMGTALAVGAPASASGGGWSPNPIGYDQLSLRGALVDCLSSYFVYSNPVPLWLEDRDFCTIGHTPYFHGVDISFKSGMQMDVIDVIEQVRSRFTDSRNSDAQRAFSRDLRSCVRTYVEVQSVHREDYCRVIPSDRTARHWRMRPGKERNVPLSRVLRVACRLLPSEA